MRGSWETAAASRAARQVPVPLAEQLHRRGQQDRAHDRRVDAGSATARPTPICLNSIDDQRGEDREHRDHHDRGAGHDAGGGLMPCATASSVLMPRSTASLIRLMMNTW